MLNNQTGGTMNKLRAYARSILLASTIGLWLLVAWLPALTHAAPSDLPPRPEIPPTTAPPVPSKGAYIELAIQGATVEMRSLWTAVQWQDGLGEWHTVEGWQGTPEEDGTKRWWVAPKDFGTGPFRWLVYQGGELLALSVSFHLPGSAGETVRVGVTLPSTTSG